MFVVDFIVGLLGLSVVAVVVDGSDGTVVDDELGSGRSAVEAEKLFCLNLSP